MRNKLFLLFTLYSLLITVYSFSVSPSEWKSATYSDFLDGELQNVSLRSDGKIMLSPQIESIYKAKEQQIWQLSVDKFNNLYIAEGTEGKLYRVKDTNVEVYFDADELNIHTIAIDKNQNVYVGTNPSGKVYKIINKDKYEVFFDPQEKYIWALSFDKHQNLYVATGEEAKIYKVDKNKKVKVLFESNETHIRCLTFDKDENLIAGTDGSGLILRLTKDGKPFVIYDSDCREINQIVVDEDNNIYASGIVGEIKKEIVQGLPPIPATGEFEIEFPEKIEEELKPEVKEKLKSEIYFINKEGYVKVIWSSNEENVLSLLFHKNNLIVGCGDKGMIYSIEEQDKINKLLKVNSKQVTHLVEKTGKIYAALSNLGEVILIKDEFATSGNFISKVYDTQTTATHWGIIKYKVETPEGTSVELFTRTGNQQTPDDALWTNWEKVKNEEYIKNIKARFIQFKANLNTKKNNISPILKEVIIYYMQQNLPPQINKIEIYSPGIYFKKLPQEEAMFEEIPTEILKKLPKKTKPKKEYKYGMRAISWEAEDKNNDELIYNVYYRSEDEKNFKLLADKLKEEYFSFDATSLPDGRYYIKIVASDELSNPNEIAQRTERISDLFIIDHTPPKFENISKKIERNKIKITFTVVDDTTPLDKVEYAIDAQLWQVCYPIDLITDSRKENYLILIDKLEKGQHSILIRAYDKNKNVQTEKVIIEIKQ